MRDPIQPKSYGMLPILLLAGVVFCVCYIGAMITALWAEESRPYELQATVREEAIIRNSDITALYQIEGVEDVTPIYSVNAVLSYDKLERAIVIYGIKGDYIPKDSIDGSIFAETGSVPQLIFNQAAAELLEDAAKKENIEVENLRNASYSVFIEGIDRKFTAKVSGILEDKIKTDEAAAYMSFDTLTRLLGEKNGTAIIDEVMIRCENISHAELIRNSLDTKILSSSAVDEKLSVRSKLIQQNLIYLIIVAAICLIFALALMRAKEKLKLPKYTHRLPVAIIANTIGVLVTLLLPFFISPEQRADALFALPVPVWALLIGIIIPFSICLFEDIISQYYIN